MMDFATEHAKFLNPPENREMPDPTWEQFVNEHGGAANWAMDETLTGMCSVDITDLLLSLDRGLRRSQSLPTADDELIRLLKLSTKLIPLCNQIRKDRAAAIESYMRNQ